MDHVLARFASEASWTHALEHVQERLRAGAIVLARLRRALLDVQIALGARVTRQALTAGCSIDLTSTLSVDARIGT